MSSVPRMPFRSLILQGAIYGALAAVAVVLIVGVIVFVTFTLQAPDEFLLNVSRTSSIIYVGTLASLHGAIGGVIIAIIARLLGRWPKVALTAAVTSGALLAAMAGTVVLLGLMGFGPEAPWTDSRFMTGYILVLVGIPALGGAVLGWLLVRRGS